MHALYKYMETETKGYFLIIVGILVFLIALSILIFSTTKSDNSPEELLEECKIIEYNGPGKINLLFFSNKEDVEEYKDFFLGTKPFDKNPEAFNFFYIDDYEPSCELYRGIAILCHSTDLIKKAASCPHDFIVVLHDEAPQIRSSAYLNVLSLNSNHLLTVFLHEFGHSFANFAEEYKSNQRPPRGSKNCVGSCDEFIGEIDGCFLECSLSNLYRSVRNGVMRTLSPENLKNAYGTSNANIINDIIIERGEVRTDSTITGKQILNTLPICRDQEFVYVDIISGEKGLSAGCAGTNGAGDYSYQILDGAGNIILSEEFNPTLFSDVQDPQTEELTGEPFSYEEVGELILTLPPIGEELEVYNPEGEQIAQETLFDVGATPCPV
jgi:hypothetical protein